jgi:hypothetical protein
MALRGLEEKAALARGMSERARERANPLSANLFGQHAAEATHAASLIRTMLESRVAVADDADAAFDARESS